MSNKNQYTFEDVQGMTFAQLGAIDDPWQLTSTMHLSPMIVRYVIRTGQLESRYSGFSLPALLGAINKAAAIHRHWPASVSQKVPLGVRDAEVDDYLDKLDSLLVR